jgi:hypothetical protein
MKTEQIYMMIDEFFDGELEKNKEPILFTHLSLNDECRDYFKSLNKIKSTLTETIEDFPQELEERILYSAANTEKKLFNFNLSGNLPAFFSYAIATVLLIASIFLYSQSLSYQEKMESKIQQVNQQDQLINLLINSLPEARVEGQIENQIVIKANS